MEAAAAVAGRPRRRLRLRRPRHAALLRLRPPPPPHGPERACDEREAHQNNRPRDHLRAAHTAWAEGHTATSERPILVGPKNDCRLRAAHTTWARTFHILAGFEFYLTKKERLRIFLSHGYGRGLAGVLAAATASRFAETRRPPSGFAAVGRESQGGVEGIRKRKKTWPGVLFHSLRRRSPIPNSRFFLAAISMLPHRSSRRRRQQHNATASEHSGKPFQEEEHVAETASAKTLHSDPPYDRYAEQRHVASSQTLQEASSITVAFSSSQQTDTVAQDTIEVFPPSGRCLSLSPVSHIWVRSVDDWGVIFYIRVDLQGSYHTYPGVGGPFQSLEEADKAIDRHLDDRRDTKIKGGNRCLIANLPSCLVWLSCLNSFLATGVVAEDKGGSLGWVSSEVTAGAFVLQCK